jgi:hypothetical protein
MEWMIRGMFANEELKVTGVDIRKRIRRWYCRKVKIKIPRSAPPGIIIAAVIISILICSPLVFEDILILM